MARACTSRYWENCIYRRIGLPPPQSFVKLAQAYGLKSMKVTKRSEVVSSVEEARRHQGTVLIDFQVEQEDSVFPMVPAGNDLHNMIRRPSAIVETGADA